jgi:hypothetical protein
MALKGLSSLRIPLLALCFGALLAYSEPSKACTTAIVSAKASATGHPLLWKNRDTGAELSYIAHFQGKKYGFTGTVESGDTLFRVWSGANDVGFCIVNNLSYNLRTPAYASKSLHAGELMKEALGCCATVDEFEEFIRREKVRGVSANFGVIDASGGAAYLEVWDGGCTRYDVSDAPEGYLVRTNYSFSGRPDEGSGYARFETANALLKKLSANGIKVEELIDGIGRSFYNSLTGRDILRDSHSFAEGDERIPRYLSVSSVVYEGVGAGDPLNSTVMWAAMGYPSCSYVVPVWVGAGEEIPSFLDDSYTDEHGVWTSQASSLATRLKHLVYRQSSLHGDAKGKYVDASMLKRIIPTVRKAERTEFNAARSLDAKFRASGIDLDAVRKYNSEAAGRFDSYREKIIRQYGL